jgi:uncharacterized protein (TIGR03643 family)
MTTADPDQHRDEIIALALSDEVAFDAIRDRFGLDEGDIKRCMRRWLRPGSYRAWRERVKRFGRVHRYYKREPRGRSR